MKNLTARVAGLATLALAALPIAALSTAAHAQGHHERVRVADLNLATASGQAAFSERVDSAARRFCYGERDLQQQSACVAGVRSEAKEKAASNIQFASRI
jgi:UrcA family protein